MKQSNTRLCASPILRALLPIVLCAALLSSAIVGAQDYVGHQAAPSVRAPPSPLWTAPVETRVQEATARPLAELSAKELARFEAMLTAEVQNTVDQQTRIPGQDQIITVRVRYNRKTDEVDIDLGQGYIPRGAIAVTEDLSDKLREVSNTVYDLLDGIFSYRFINEQFGGKDISDFFDELKKPAQGNKNYKRGPSTQEPAPVVLSPAHGWYFHYGSVNSRVLQRPSETNGILEDLLTPAYAIELGNELSSRNDGDITFISSTRSLYDTSVNSESGKPWNHMAARYYLKRLLPDRTDIWNAYPNGTRPNRLALREYDEDIASRPRFADYLSAGALLSLHTNASSNLAARGTQIYVSKSSRASVDLGNHLLCFMKEVIRAQPGYEDWRVDDSVRAGSYGENAAAAPAVIVEIGFHSNQADAAALKDPAFRQASMKGIAKGYQMHKRGNPCQHFQVDGIADTTGPQNTSVPVAVHYRGFPRFPVRATVKFLTCPSGWTCATFTRTFHSEQSSPLGYDHRCNTSGSSHPTSTFRIRTTLTDADNVQAVSEYAWTCTSPVNPAP